MDRNDMGALRDSLLSLEKILAGLLQVEKKKTDALEKGDVGALDPLINAEQAFLMECACIEKKRAQICEKLKVKTVSELLETLPAAEDDIGDVYPNLLTVTKEVQKLNAINMKLLDTRLKVVKLLTCKLGLSVEDARYDKGAQAIGK